MRTWDDILRSMASGGAASVSVRTIEAPLERIKILLQNQNMAPEHHRRYAGAIDAAKRIVAEQGFFSFWRGNLTNCLRVVPSTALRFTFMDHYQSLAAAVCGVPDSSKLPLHGQMLSGGLSGATTALVVYPLDLTRTRLSADVGVTRQYSGIIDCVVKTTKQHGILGNYRGLLVSLLEITPYTGLSLGGYEYFKHFLPSDEKSQSSWWFQIQKLGVGWVSGLTGSLVCYPLDTIKRQLMLDGSLGFQSKYDGSIITCGRVLYCEGGVRSFYNGCLFNALKAAPSAALTLVINDVFRKLSGFVSR